MSEPVLTGPGGSKWIARQDDPELNRLARLGSWLAAAESGRDDPTTKGAAAALRFHFAEAMQLPPLAALELSVIKGRVVPSAQLLRALADEAGLRVVRVDSSKTACTAAIVDKQTGQELGRTTFTLEQAKQAGLVKPNGNWQTYPERMLWARASGWAVRDYAPRVALGMTFADEVEEVTGVPYDVDGEVIPSDDAVEAWAAAQAATQEDATIDMEPPDGTRPATDAHLDTIATLIQQLVGLELELGLEPTDWNAWVEREGRTVSGGPLTRENARRVIALAEVELKRLRGLTGP